MMTNSLMRKFAAIRLSDKEKKVFDALLEANRAFDKGTVMRAAGGWVRDKLMGNESTDIDIALDNVSGDEFALFVYDREQKFGHCSSVGVVKENPAQSKHIRTASFRFHDLDIDMNNLRSETYTEDSRIPEVRFAQHPSEDALRRDFTINAMYYNLNTGEVEDYTGQGLQDLESGIIRTPLEALKTIVDDPLRVLRAIRFASRFNFKLSADIEQAWLSESVRSGLVTKVSRERIGTEITKMMEHKNALKAVDLLNRSGIIRLVLTPPVYEDEAVSLSGISKDDYKNWTKSMDCGSSDIDINEIILKIQEFDTLKGSLPITFPHFPIFHLALLVYRDLYLRKLILLICKLSMKLPNEKCKSIESILESAVLVREACKNFFEQNSTQREFVISIGRIVRTTLKGLAREGILFALLTDPHLHASEVHRLYNQICDILDVFDIYNCHTWKPVVDGVEIQKLLGISPGKIIQGLLNAQFDLMFAGERDRGTIIAAMQAMIIDSKA